MQWFGPAPFSHLCDEVEHVQTPAAPCVWCEEDFTATDEGYTIPLLGATSIEAHQPYHLECHLRTIVGSVGHQQGRCSCHGGTEGDPPEMTKREAARAAVAEFQCL